MNPKKMKKHVLKIIHLLKNNYKIYNHNLNIQMMIINLPLRIVHHFTNPINYR
jgi:hypothetical protein